MSPAVVIIFQAFAGALVALVVYCFMVTMGWTQGGRQKCQCRGKKGNGRGAQPLGKRFVLLEPLQPSGNHCPSHTEIDNSNEISQQLNSSTRDLTRLLDMPNCEKAENSNSSLTSNMGSEDKVNSVQDHQQDGEIRLHAPTLINIHSGEREHNKGQDTMEGLIPEPRLEHELGLPINVEETLQNVPASAPPTPHRCPSQEKRDVVVPIVDDLPFLDEAVKRDLEALISKLNIQRRYGLQRRILECETCFEYLTLKGKASQTFPPE